MRHIEDASASNLLDDGGGGVLTAYMLAMPRDLPMLT